MPSKKLVNPEAVIETPVLQVAKEIRAEAHDIYVTESGVKVRLHPVASTIIQRVYMQMPMPAVPIWHDPERDRDEPNPNDPNYIKECNETKARIAMASMNAMVMFGVELIDGVPEDNGWVARLHAIGIDVGAETDDPTLARELAYKKYIAIAGTSDLQKVLAAAGVTAAGVNAAVDSFRS